MTELHRATEETLALRDLRPNPKTNDVLSQLVSCVTQLGATLDGISPEVRAKVRRLSAQAEGYMEEYWAERIAQSSDPRAEAQRFWYWDNYAQLTRCEMALLEETGLTLHGVRRALMIGSGPLPMTVLHMADYMPDAKFTHIDNDPTAVTLGERCSGVLGNRGEYLCADGAEAPLTGEYDIALVAALAGETVVEKQAIVDTVAKHLSWNGRLLVRGAQGVRGLLYPVFPADSFSGVTLLREYHPKDDIINSVFIYGRERA